jgi:hypothetical protein
VRRRFPASVRRKSGLGGSGTDEIQTQVQLSKPARIAPPSPPPIPSSKTPVPLPLTAGAPRSDSGMLAPLPRLTSALRGHYDADKAYLLRKTVLQALTLPRFLPLTPRPPIAGSSPFPNRCRGKPDDFVLFVVSAGRMTSGSSPGRSFPAGTTVMFSNPSHYLSSLTHWVAIPVVSFFLFLYPFLHGVARVYVCL